MVRRRRRKLNTWERILALEKREERLVDDVAALGIKLGKLRIEKARLGRRLARETKRALERPAATDLVDLRAPSTSGFCPDGSCP